MAEASKSFWGKLNKKNLLTNPIPSELPIDLLQMFPSMSPADLYTIYHHQCNDSISQTANYLTRHQPSDHIEDLDIPMETLMASLNDATIQPVQNQDAMNHFQSTPTHVLSHIFAFHGPMVWGVLTRVNRECRLIAKSLLARIRSYDFAHFYDYRCQFANDDDLRLVTFINAFPYLESLSLRNSHFTKWTDFQSLINWQHVRSLNLSGSLNLFDDDIGLILEHFSTLTKLDLSRCIELSDEALANIAEYEVTDTLRQLNLNHIPVITVYGLHKFLRSKSCVVDIELKGTKIENLGKAFEGAAHLRSINVSSASRLQRLELTEVSMTSGRTSNGPHPDGFDLDLINCRNLTFVELDIAHLVSLNVSQCVKLKEVRVSNAARLRSLQCRFCKVLELVAVPTDSVKSATLSGCNALNMELLFDEKNFIICSLNSGTMCSLDLSHIQHLSTDDLERLLTVNAENGNGLKALSVAECREIPKEWRTEVYKKFKRPCRRHQYNF